MVHGSRLMTHGQGRPAQPWRPSEASAGPGPEPGALPRALGPSRRTLAMNHQSRAMSKKQSTIHDRLIIWLSTNRLISALSMVINSPNNKTGSRLHVLMPKISQEHPWYPGSTRVDLVSRCNCTSTKQRRNNETELRQLQPAATSPHTAPRKETTMKRTTHILSHNAQD